MWTVTVVTSFKELYPGPFDFSLAGKAMEKKIWSLNIISLKDFGVGKHNKIDEPPFGGGAGMVIRPDVVDAALQEAQKVTLSDKPVRMVHLSPRGKPLTQQIVKELSVSSLILLCGRYEGIDQRVLDAYPLEEISVGDYILSNGDLAAYNLIDACLRLQPGFMGKEESHQEDSFETGLLEYPLYTQPRHWNGREVPEVLLSGHHAAIKKWRQQQSEAITKERRPDLWLRYEETKG